MSTLEESPEQTDSTSDSGESPRLGRFPLFARLGEAVVQVAASAGELLSDRDLRRKAGSLVVTEAGKRIKDIQDGVATRAGNIQRGLNEGPRQVQSLYSRIQKQYQTSRHEASLKARRDTPVDVQVGPFLWEDAPQELRSRLWIALLGNPYLIGSLVDERELELNLLRTVEHTTPARSSHQASSSNSSLDPGSLTGENRPAAKLSPQQDAETGSTALHAQGQAAQDSTAPQEAACTRHSPVEQPQCGRSSGGCNDGAQAGAEIRSEPHAHQDTLCKPDDSAQEPLHGQHHSSSQDEAEEIAVEERQDSGSSPEDAWEIVQAGSSLNDFRGSQLATAQLQPGKRGAAMTLRERLLEAVCEVAWPISTVYPEGCRYDTLCQISIGQEEVEEVIQRDINRTFPEHPQFSFEQGQQELFRVLKAYSLHDLQVGYCQGMAFVTGVILMYIPEEPAFRLLTRLMDNRGANLRLLYLPGLEGLKNYLRMFEWLMNRLLPDLREHLETFGVVPVLYASQWFLTAFSCPFPTAFACRVLDVILIENSGHVMLRVGLAVIRACWSALMELHDFEDLVTYLKVEPVKWSQQKARIVLNEAIEGAVGDDLLQAAAEAVSNGYDGSLSRRTSTVKPDTGTSSNPLVERKGSVNRQGSKGPLAVPSRLPALDEIVPAETDGSQQEQNGVQAEEAKPVDDGELLIALDALWVGEHSNVSPASSWRA